MVANLIEFHSKPGSTGESSNSSGSSAQHAMTR
jgi:hypothetical protein